MSTLQKSRSELFHVLTHLPQLLTVSVMAVALSLLVTSSAYGFEAEGIFPPHQRAVLIARSIGYNKNGTMTVMPRFGDTLFAGTKVAGSDLITNWAQVPATAGSTATLANDHGLVTAFYYDASTRMIAASEQTAFNVNTYVAASMPQDTTTFGITFTVGQNSDGSVQVAIVGSDFRVYTCRFDHGSCTSWQALSTAGNFYDSGQSIQFAVNKDGRLQLFMTRTVSGTQTATIDSTWQDVPSGTFQPVQPLPGAALILSNALKVGINANGKISLFGYDYDNRTIYTRTQKKASDSANFGAWTSMGTYPDGGHDQVQFIHAQIITSDDDRMYLVSENPMASPHSVLYRSQTVKNGAWSATWSSLAGNLAAQAGAGPIVGMTRDGRMQTFVVGTDNVIATKWQTAPSGDSWSPTWAEFSGQPAGTPALN